MKWEGKFQSARAVTAAVAIFLFLPPPDLSWSAEADLLPTSLASEAREAALAPESERKADAIARFVQGLLEEESEGPEKSLETFLQALALDPGHVELAMRISQDYLRRGDTVSALAVLKDAHKARPDNPDISVALSLIYLRHLQKADLALRYAQRALDAAPATLPPYEALWEIHVSQGNPTKATEALNRAAKSGSEDPYFWIALAELTGRRLVREAGTIPPGTTEKVLTYLQKAVEFSNDDAQALARAGDLLALSRNTSQALAAYEKAYAKKASLPDLRAKLAACYIELNRNADAIRILEEIVRLDSLKIEAYDRLSQLYLREGDLRKAAANARQALVLDPSSIERHEVVVDMLFKLEEYSSAADTLAAARKEFPANPKLAFIHGVALSHAKRHDEAMRAFEEAAVEAANIQPEALDGDFYFHYGAAAEQAGRHEKAAQMFKRSIKIDPTNAARAYNYLGYMWVDRNEFLDEAEQLIRRALELDPTNGAYIDSLGWLFYRQGKFEDALATLLRAAEHLPEPDPVVYDHIGDAYDKLGRLAEAVLYWKKAQGLDPENEEIAKKIDDSTDQIARQPGDPQKR